MSNFRKELINKYFLKRKPFESIGNVQFFDLSGETVVLWLVGNLYIHDS